MVKNPFKKDKNKEAQNAEEDLGNMVKQYQTEAHKLPKEQILLDYETDFERGLSNEIFKRKQEVYGKNMLTPPKESPLIIKFLKTLFFDIFNILLLVGSVLCIVAYLVNLIGSNISTPENAGLAAVLFMVVLITASFSTYQEHNSSKIMKGFANFLPQKINVYRDGILCEKMASEIVPGDILTLKAGEKIPADLLVISCTSDSKVDNSSITGECEPQQRSAEMTSEEPLETKNLCFFGTLFVQGNATCMVISTGDHTLMGQIAKLASQTNSGQTPIGKEIKLFVKFISIIALVLAIVLSIINGVISKDAINTLVFFIGIIVANVPEGLLVTLTVSLTLAAKKMSQRSVLVKNLESVETLGSTSVICSDKTGTLTVNKMTVAHIFYDLKECAVDTHDPTKGEFDSTKTGFERLTRCATLCNNAKFNNENVIVGDASESALVKFSVAHLDISIKQFRENNKIVHSIPFNSKNKWQLSIHNVESDCSSNLVVMKGAPERILTFCDRIYVDGEIQPLDEEKMEKINETILNFARQGERILGFCEQSLEKNDYPKGFEFKGELPDKANFPFKNSLSDKGYIFIGLAAMIDPPRPSVPLSVLKCQSAGIRVFMVTGDHPTTARAIASKVNIINPTDTVLDLNELQSPTLADLEGSHAQACVVTGRHINLFVEDKSPDEQRRFWNSVMSHKRIVFSRTSPQHKLMIVEACQQRNSIVAVTGDGVNDSPALKKADIGVAMGITGTDVAKDAADMILLDDNFSSIVNGIEEGRILFDNLKKSIFYTLTSNIPEIFPFILSFLLGLPIPLKTVQIFIIDLGTDMVPAISMAYEKKEADIMSRPPRNPLKDRLVSKVLISFSYLLIGMLQMLAGIFTYLCVFKLQGFEIKHLYALDKNFAFENTKNDAAYTYLSCYATQFQGKFCQYTRNIIPQPPNVVVIVDNMDVAQRRKILSSANSGYVMSIVFVQFSDILISKTRIKSLFSQGMGNKLMNFGIALEFALVAFLIYTPFVSSSLFSLGYLDPWAWVMPMPYFILIFGFDELRKVLLRKNFHGWLKRNTYW